MRRLKQPSPSASSRCREDLHEIFPGGVAIEDWEFSWVQVAEICRRTPVLALVGKGGETGYKTGWQDHPIE